MFWPFTRENYFVIGKIKVETAILFFPGKALKLAPSISTRETKKIPWGVLTHKVERSAFAEKYLHMCPATEKHTFSRKMYC